MFRSATLSFLLILASCGTKKTTVPLATFSNPMEAYFSVPEHFEVVEGNGIDSRIGVIRIGDQEFAYDYGRYGYRGPVSLASNFYKTFRNYHYSKFFMLLGMDEKAFTTLRKEVDVVRIVPRDEFFGTLMQECSACNAVAVLRFQGTEFNYPYSDSQEIIQNEKEYDFEEWVADGVYYRIYYTDMMAGYYAHPLDDDGLKDKLAVVCRTCLALEAKDLLREIRLKAQPD